VAEINNVMDATDRIPRFPCPCQGEIDNAMFSNFVARIGTVPANGV